MFFFSFSSSYLCRRRKGRSLMWLQRPLLTLEHRPGPVSIQSAYCPVSSLCDSLLFDFRLFGTVQCWPLPFSGPPSRGQPLRWRLSISPLNPASAWLDSKLCDSLPSLGQSVFVSLPNISIHQVALFQFPPPHFALLQVLAMLQVAQFASCVSKILLQS